MILMIHPEICRNSGDGFELHRHGKGNVIIAFAKTIPLQ